MKLIENLKNNCKKIKIQTNTNVTNNLICRLNKNEVEEEF